jgi:hypothetical protein
LLSLHFIKNTWDKISKQSNRICCFITNVFGGFPKRYTKEGKGCLNVPFFCTTSVFFFVWMRSASCAHLMKGHGFSLPILINIPNQTSIVHLSWGFSLTPLRPLSRYRQFVRGSLASSQ